MPAMALTRSLLFQVWFWRFSLPRSFHGWSSTGQAPCARFLGANGVDSLSRIMGFILICIGAQFVINGVRDLILDAAFWRSIS